MRFFANAQNLVYSIETTIIKEVPFLIFEKFSKNLIFRSYLLHCGRNFEFSNILTRYLQSALNFISENIFFKELQLQVAKQFGALGDIISLYLGKCASVT